jgi:putative membrane-bound dehydrogenase-like protein
MKPQGALILILCAATLPALVEFRLSRAQALAPELERSSFQLADERLTIELVAAESNVVSPVAIAWDSAGRMFVAEMIDYPLGPTAGQVRVLEDKNGDGKYETSTVFADNLSFPNSVLPWKGGVLVTTAPDILFLKDNDGDGRADERRVILTGFAEGNQQLRVNGLHFGWDGWIYGANGRSDGEMQLPGGGKKISLRGHDFRFRPESGEFEAIAGRSQFGLSFDDWGNRFLSWNTIPIRHEVIEERFLARNPRINPTEAVHDLLPEGDDIRVYPLTPTPQTFNNESTSHFNALAGLTIYRGDLLPAEYKGNAFMGETLRNLVHRRVLEPTGATFVARRAEQGKEFLASTDPWFHPVNFTTGPDGALYVVDFYRQWVEHPGYVPEKFRDNYAWRTGAEHGRIWRIRARSARAAAFKGDLARKSTDVVIAELENPNGWWRDMALRVLTERQDTNGTQKLKAEASKSSMPEARLGSLYAVAATSQLDEPTLINALQDQHPRVREAALKLSEGRFDGFHQLLPAVKALSRDKDSRVQLQVALRSFEFKEPQRTSTLIQLSLSRELDSFCTLAIRSSLGDRPWLLLENLWKENTRQRAAPAATLTFMRDMAEEVAQGKNIVDQRNLVSTLRTFMSRKKEDVAVFAGYARGGGPSADLDEQWFAQLVRAARELADSKEPVLSEIAMTALAYANNAEARAALIGFLLPKNPPEATAAAAEVVSRSGDLKLFQSAFDSWHKYLVSTRRRLLAGAIRSPLLASNLVEAVERGNVSVAELDANLRQNLLQTKNSDVKQRLENLFGSEISTDRNAIVEKFSPALKMSGYRKRGAVLFAKVCLQCHAFEGRGQKVGPDLSGISSKPKETLLVDILDPNRSVPSDYVSYTIETTNNEALNGLIVSENASAIVLRRPNLADVNISRDEIKEAKASGKSLMPDGLESGLSIQEMVDLLEFLRQPDRSLLPE